MACRKPNRRGLKQGGIEMNTRTMITFVGIGLFLGSLPYPNVVRPVSAELSPLPENMVLDQVAQLGEVERREFERREVEKREIERRKLETQKPVERDLERRDLERRGIETQAPAARDLERRDLERRELERREFERR